MFFIIIQDFFRKFNANKENALNDSQFGDIITEVKQ